MADDFKSPIARINELSALARGAWLSLLGCLAFLAITMLSMTDADFLINTRMIELPVVQTTIPNYLFLSLAPIVTTVLYVNLHLYLSKLWQAFDHAPCDEDAREKRLADQIQPWLVNDYALTLKEGARPRDHERALLRNLVTLFTVWYAAPLLLAWAWCKSLLAHDAALTFVIFACVAITVAVGLRSWLQAHYRLRNRAVAIFTEPLHLFLVAFLLVGVTATLTLTGKVDLTDRYPATMALLERRINIDRENLVGDLGGGHAAKAQREEFRLTWCAGQGVAPKVCGNLPAETVAETNKLTMKRRTYCRSQLRMDGIAGAIECARYFDALDAGFDTAWAEVRREKLAQLPKLDLTGRDMAGASAEFVTLTGARLDAADLSNARLRNAEMEGADLIGAKLAGITAFYANLDLANMTVADLRDAELVSASLRGATLYGASLRGARLRHANLVAADLRDADLRGADLRGARLFRTRLDGAILAGADLTGAVGLTQAQLASAIGDADTKFSRPATIKPDQRPAEELLTVLSCWPSTEPPEKRMIFENPGLSAAEKGEITRFACPGDDPPRAVGTTETPGRPAGAPAANVRQATLQSPGSESLWTPVSGDAPATPDAGTGP